MAESHADEDFVFVALAGNLDDLWGESGRDDDRAAVVGHDDVAGADEHLAACDGQVDVFGEEVHVTRAAGGDGG